MCDPMGVMSDIMCLLLEIVTVTVQKKFQKEKALAPSIEKKKSPIKGHIRTLEKKLKDILYSWIKRLSIEKI